MYEICDFYKDKYNTELKDDIIGDTSGNFQKLCLLLVKSK